MDTINDQTRPWSAGERLLFRFIFLLFLLFIIFFNNGTYPFFEVVMDKPTDLLHRFIPWVGKRFLHLSQPITVFTNGSGDTTYDYVALLCVAVASLAGCLVWSLADRRRPHYRRLFYWLTVLVRFYVALMLINYGLVKVFKLQFPSPGLSRLSQPYGASSPMGLAWTFLGFSKGYNVFMGLAEIASILLLFRRTVAVGAIICLMTTANVMAVNYFYDVPVKIVSTSLVIFSLFLLSPNFKVLFGFFFRGRAAALQLVPPPVYTKKWLRYSLRGLKALIFVYLAWGAWQSYGMLKEYGDLAPKPPLYGTYEVSAFTSANSTGQAPDSVRWKRMIVEWPGSVSIKAMNDTVKYYSFAPDTVKHEIAMSTYEDTTTVYRLHYAADSAKMHVYGRLEGDSISVQMSRMRPESYRLMNRGFHWINEYPYNR